MIIVPSVYLIVYLKYLYCDGSCGISKSHALDDFMINFGTVTAILTCFMFWEREVKF